MFANNITSLNNEWYS